MTGSWMLRMAAATALILAAAVALEASFTALGRPRRWAWVIGLVATFVLPFLPRPDFRLALPTSRPSVAKATIGAPLEAVPESMTDSPPREARFPWMALWAATSVILSTAALGGWGRLRRRRRGWRRLDLEGEEVLVSPDLGPAVVGVRRPAIVVPEWLLGMPADFRRIAIIHERQHLRARDHLLLGLAPVVAIVMPWNLGLWVMLNRLRATIELDCDQRTLSEGIDMQDYGTVLIAAAGRGGAKRPAPGLAASASRLEGRILALTSRASRSPVRALARGTLAVLVGSGSWFTSVGLAWDRQPREGTENQLVSGRGMVRGRPDTVERYGAYTPDQVDEPPRAGHLVAAKYPPVLEAAGITGEVVLEAVVDLGGKIEERTIRVVKSTHAGFVGSAKAALIESSFIPAVRDSISVRAWIVRRFSFGKGSGERSGRVTYSRTEVDQLPVAIEFEVPAVESWHDSVGSVRLSFVVTEKGRVDPATISIVESSNDVLRGPAIAALTKAVFTPGKIEGRPVRTRTQKLISFGTATSPDAVYEIANVEEMVLVVADAPPMYPAVLRAAGISGTVTVEWVVDTDGKPALIRVLKSTNQGFITPAIEAVLKSTYRPAKRGGVPVRVRVIRTFSFSA